MEHCCKCTEDAVIDKYMPIIVKAVQTRVIEQMNKAVETINNGVCSNILLLDKRVQAMEKIVNE